MLEYDSVIVTHRMLLLFLVIVPIQIVVKQYRWHSCRYRNQIPVLMYLLNSDCFVRFYLWQSLVHHDIAKVLRIDKPRYLSTGMLGQNTLNMEI